MPEFVQPHEEQPIWKGACYRRGERKSAACCGAPICPSSAQHRSHAEIDSGPDCYFEAEYFKTIHQKADHLTELRIQETLVNNL